MVRKKTETRGHSRKTQAWARNKNKLMNDLSGDVWGRDNKQDESDWEQVTCEDEEEDELSARSAEKAKGSTQSIVLVTKRRVVDLLWVLAVGWFKAFLIGSPFLFLYFIHNSVHRLIFLESTFGITFREVAICLYVICGAYYFLHFLLLVVLEFARRHFERHRRLFFVAIYLWHRVIDFIVVLGLYIIKYSSLTLIDLSEKGENTLEKILRIGVAYEVIFLIADYIGISIAAKYFWAPQAERSREPIICQTLCKILIEYVQGIDTIKEQKFALQVLDGYPLFYQPLYISGALVISSALTEFVDKATRGQALAQAYHGNVDTTRDRLITEAVRKDKSDTTLAIHFLYDMLVCMGKRATVLPTPVMVAPSKTLPKKTSSSCDEDVETVVANSDDGQLSVQSSQRRSTLVQHSDDSLHSLPYDDCSSSGSDIESTSTFDTLNGANDENILRLKHLKPFLHKRLAKKLLHATLGETSVRYIAKDHFTQWYTEIIKARRLQGVTISDVEEMLCLLLNVIYVFAWVIFAIFTFAQLSTDYQATLLSLSTFILAFSFLFGSSASVLFDSCVFIMATHPYDVGDRILCVGDYGNEENMEVVKVNLLTTEFMRWDGQLMIVQNVKMMKRDIRNMKRSPYSAHLLWVTIPPVTDWELVEGLKVKMEAFRRQRKDLKLKLVEVCVRDLDRNGLKILIYVEQRVSFQDNTLRYKVQDTCQEEIVLACRSLGIDVTSGVAVQPVELISDEKLDEIRRGRRPSSLFSNDTFKSN